VVPSFHFFTSYAHADSSEDDLLRTFYHDIAVELRRTMGLPPQEFLDAANIASGEDWRRSLAGALGSAKCLLAFYSPSYFNSAECGKEVAAFQERLERFRNDPGNATIASVFSLMVGVLWENKFDISDRIPKSLTDYQYGVPHFQDAARKDDPAVLNKTVEVRQLEVRDGLRKIMQLKAANQNYQQAYIEIVNRYSAHIKAVTTQCDLSNYPFTGDYRTLRPVFPVHLSPAEAAVPTPATGARGPKYVRVLFIVGKRDSFAGLNDRRNLEGYADDPQLWQPFLPDADDEIGPIVLGAVASEKMNAEVVSASTGIDAAMLDQIIDNAARDNKVMVVIIDPWSVFIPTLQSVLKALDRRRTAYGSMFLCWNEKDPDTTAKASKLQAQLEETFENTTQENTSLLSEITFKSLQDLESQLRAKIIFIKNRILDRLARQGQVRPLPPGTPLPSTQVPVR
jgi:FxsC-like protein